MRPATALLLALAAVAAVAAPARAATAPDPVGSGTANLTLAASFGRLLASHGVALSATAPATSKGAIYALPVAEGQVDPTASRLELEAGGNLTFERGRRRVVLRHLTVRSAPVPLLAKVGGGQLKVATAGARRFSRAGFDSAFRASGLQLTAKVATRLSKKLSLPGAFAGGQLLGTLRARVSPATVSVLPSGRLDLFLDPSFVAKLESLFVSVNPVAPAERVSSEIFTVPFVPSGTIAPDASSGVPRTGGSLEFLQLGSGQLFWHELWFDLGARQALAEADIEPTPAYPGKLGQLPVLELDPTSAKVLSEPKARAVSVSGIGLALSATGADEFDRAFAGGGSTFQAGEALGSVAFVAATR